MVPGRDGNAMDCKSIGPSGTRFDSGRHFHGQEYLPGRTRCLSVAAAADRILVRLRAALPQNIGHFDPALDRFQNSRRRPICVRMSSAQKAQNGVRIPLNKTWTVSLVGLKQGTFNP